MSACFVVKVAVYGCGIESKKKDNAVVQQYTL
jgi:hypothetical protein